MLDPRPLHAVLLTVAVAIAVVVPSTPSLALAGASIVVSSASGLPSDSGAQDVDEDDDDADDASDDSADADDDGGSDDASDDASDTSDAPAATSGGSEIDRAKKASASSPTRSSGSSTTKGTAAPAAPTRVQAAAIGRTSVRLHWHAVAGGSPRGYVARIRHGASTRELRVGPSARNASFAGLTAGTRYAASVTAVGGTTSAVQHVRTAPAKTSKRERRLEAAAAAALRAAKRAATLAKQLQQAAAAG